MPRSRHISFAARHYLCEEKQIDMWAKKLKIWLLCLAGCIAFVPTMIPHHHHGDGTICWMIDALKTVNAHSSHHNNSDEAPDDCGGCNWFAYKLPVDTISLNQSLLKFAPVKILLGTWAVLSDFMPEQSEASPYFGVYVERLHPAVFLGSSGLRAPPQA